MCGPLQLNVFLFGGAPVSLIPLQLVALGTARSFVSLSVFDLFCQSLFFIIFFLVVMLWLSLSVFCPSFLSYHYLAVLLVFVSLSVSWSVCLLLSLFLSLSFSLALFFNLSLYISISFWFVSVFLCPCPPSSVSTIFCPSSFAVVWALYLLF